MMGFSWAFLGGGLVKKLCKSLLKKKLGDLLLGEIDSDQLDVQLAKGTIFLSDLALNAEYINSKLSQSSIMLKEGSMKSLSLKVPFNLSSVEIEVEDLELILGPFVTTGESPCHNHNSALVDDDRPQEVDSENVSKSTTVSSNFAPASRDVDEGVKRIAKAVKWFLTSFRFRIKNIYVVFDPRESLNNTSPQLSRSLVLRIRETEFGTCLSEDSLVKLNNFLKLQDVVVELLQMEDVDQLHHSDLQSSDSGKSLSESITTILTGPAGGFSAVLNLSIPWKNGSLNLQKLDADISLDPLQLRVQPSSIEWALSTWNSLQNNVLAKISPNINTTGASSRIFSSLPTGPGKIGVDVSSISFRNSSKGMSHTGSQDGLDDAFLLRTYVIQNWVPESTDKDLADNDSDYDASIDQFFECFEEMRSSQMSSGASGIWNWTCSVLNAISVATNLASGSDHAPQEQLMEKTLRARVAEICFVLSFNDNKENICSVNNNPNPFGQKENNGLYVSCLSSVHADSSTMPDGSNCTVHCAVSHLEARCDNVTLNLETYPDNLKFQISVGNTKVSEYYNKGMHTSESGMCWKRPFSLSTILHRDLRKEIEASLLPFPESNICLDDSNLQSGFVKVELLSSFGKCSLHYNASQLKIDDRSMISTSMNMILPPFVFWIHFHLIRMLLDLVDKVEKLTVASKSRTELVLAESDLNTSTYKDAEDHTLSPEAFVSSNRRLNLNIVLSTSRIIFCFPSKYDGDFRHPYSLANFVVLDHFSSSNGKESSQMPPKPGSSAGDGHICSLSSSIYIDLRRFNIYFVESVNSAESGDFQHETGQMFSSTKVLSATHSDGWNCPGITLTWKNCSTTGLWMATRAWNLSVQHEQKFGKKDIGDGTNFCRAATLEELRDASSAVQQEIVLSSEFVLHMRFFHVAAYFAKRDFEKLNHLINCVSDGFSKQMNSQEKGKGYASANEGNTLQTSFFLECGILDISIELDKIVEANHLLQTELLGFWKCFKLHVRKFELLSSSNIGRVRNSSFLCFNHSEGQLWGSIVSKDEKSCDVAKDILLVVCNLSAGGRGNGEGTNALSFGAVGSSLTHIWNPDLCQSYTSVVLYCGTIIAPGGRLDWINAICSLFSSTATSKENLLSNDVDTENVPSKSCEDSGTFFLDLVDIALSYEPYNRSTLHGEASEFGPSFVFEPIEKHHVACLLAAASFTLFSDTRMNIGTTYYSIQLQDVGLLICESTGSRNPLSGYGVSYLQQNGYVKVVQNTILDATLKIHEYWELSLSNSQFNIDTCNDTTCGLIRLATQLQLLYAPDIQDALEHLQSRWNSIREGSADLNMPSDFSDSSHTSTSQKAVDDSKSMGLLDEVFDNAFSMEEDCTADDCLGHSHSSPTSFHLEDKPKLDTGVSDMNDEFIVTYSIKSSLAAPRDSCLDHVEANIVLPHFLDAYCLADPGSSPSTSKDQISNELHEHYRRDLYDGNGRWYDDGSLSILEDHIGEDHFSPEKTQPREGFKSDCSDHGRSCTPKGKIDLKSINVRWRMHGGVDWVGCHRDSSCNWSSERSCNSFMWLILSGLNIQCNLYPDEEINVSKLIISAKDINVYDGRHDAPWKMVMGKYKSKGHPTESSSFALRLVLETVRPEPLIPLEDYRLHVELFPLRVHLDQGQLNFLVNFFQNDSLSDTLDSPYEFDEFKISSNDQASFGSQKIVQEALLPFFQVFDVSPLVVRFDYIPRQFDPVALSRGNYAELLNVVPWKGIDLKLKHVYASGVYGWGRVCEMVLGEWLEDISHNQVRNLLKGLAPIRSLCAVTSGTSKLVSLPVWSYKKDGKLLKGIQRGAIAFIRSISLEAVGLGVHLAAGVHDILNKTECILTTTPPQKSNSERKRKKAIVRSNQPESTQEGIQQAYESITDGFGRTAAALVGSPMKIYQRGSGAGSALASAFHAAPGAAIAPVSASARAAHYALLGLRNSLDPEHRRESKEKYHGPSDQ